MTERAQKFGERRCWMRGQAAPREEVQATPPGLAWRNFVSPSKHEAGSQGGHLPDAALNNFNHCVPYIGQAIRTQLPCNTCEQGFVCGEELSWPRKALATQPT